MTTNTDQFTNLSKQEFEIFSRLSYEQKRIITNAQLKTYLPAGYKNPNRFISNLMQKNILTYIKKGFYSVNPIESMPIGWQINDYAIGNIFFPKKNYYIGYYNMFNRYGLTKQIPQTTFIINTSLSAKKTINNLSFEFIKAKNEFMYGIIETKYMDELVMISDKERTMIDFIYCWNFKEAKKEIVKILKQDKCDIKKFINYAIKFPIIKVRKYAGLFLDEAKVSQTLINPLTKSIKDSSIISTSNFSRTGIINKKWGLIINDL